VKINLVFIGILLVCASVSALTVCNDTTYWDTHPSFTKVIINNQTFYVYSGTNASNLSHPTCMHNGNLLGAITTTQGGGTSLIPDDVVRQIGGSVHPSIEYCFTKESSMFNTNARMLFRTGNTAVFGHIIVKNGTHSMTCQRSGPGNYYMKVETKLDATGDYICYCIASGTGACGSYADCIKISGDYCVNWSLYADINCAITAINLFQNSTLAPKINTTLGYTASWPTINFGGFQSATNPLSVGFWKNENNYSARIYTQLSNAKTLSGVPMFIKSTAVLNGIVVRPGTSSYDVALWASEPFANNYTAYIISTSSTLIKPKYSLYLPNYLPNMTLIPDRYSPTTLTTTLYANVATIVQDEFGVCYFVPPYTPTNYSLTYTLTAYQIDCGATTENMRSIPTLPTYSVCYSNGTHLIMNSSYTDSSLFERYITYANATVQYKQSTGTDYYEAIELTNTTAIIELKVNNYSRCYWDNETKIFGLDDVPQSELTNTIIIAPLLVLTTALSIYNPFVFIFTIALNDMFQLVDMTGILLMAVAVGLFSFISAWDGEKTLKALITLFLITGVYVVQMAVYSPTTFGSGSSDLTYRITQIADTFNSITTSGDIVAIITLVVPLFLINLIILLLELPALLVGLIFTSLTTLLPAMAGPLNAFQIALTVGAYAWLILKAYELGRNMFRGV